MTSSSLFLFLDLGLSGMNTSVTVSDPDFGHGVSFLFVPFRVGMAPDAVGNASQASGVSLGASGVSREGVVLGPVAVTPAQSAVWFVLS